MLFAAYFGYIYVCVMAPVNFSNIYFHQFVVAYNNSFRILNNYSITIWNMYCTWKLWYQCVQDL